MKKYFFTAVAALTIAASGVTYMQNQKTTALNDLALENVEALANGESGGNNTCYNSITTQEGSQVLYCQTCSWIKGTYSWFSGSGKC